MSELIRLENRSVIEISGADAHDFLQGILTNDIDGVEGGGAIYAGLLMPQGKLLFDFFIVKHDDTYLVDVDAALVEGLIKRLMFYKLRADVEIAILGQAVICASFDASVEKAKNSIVYGDPRFEKMGTRVLMFDAPGKECQPATDKWLAHRIFYGLPEVGEDYAHGNCFPHDIGMDQLNGIGFNKGCYVGQEVVSRMQHRGTARKRPMIVTAKDDLPAAPGKIEADGKLIGTLGSVSGCRGIAEIRLDRASKALENSQPFSVGGVVVELLRPPWADYGEEFATAGE